MGRGGTRLDNKQPFEIVRSIQAIQDQIVRGSAGARAKLPKLIEQISERLLAVDQDVWRDPRNARAAVIYTLSGGQARVIRKVIEIGLSPEPELALMHGALAYAEGHEADAKKLLSGIDARTLSPETAGHVAMILIGFGCERGSWQSDAAARSSSGSGARNIGGRDSFAPRTRTGR